MRRIVFSGLTLAILALGCAGASHWAKLETPYGQFAVDTVNTDVVGDGLVETWIKEVDRSPAYTYWFVNRTESETQIELDCVNLLMRPKRANYWMDHRRVAARRAHPAERLWTDLRDPVDFENPAYNRADFLYRHACVGPAMAGYVTVANQRGERATISLYYRDRRIPLGTVAPRSRAVLPFSCPTDDFQFIVDLPQPEPQRGTRPPERVPCRLTEPYYATPGDTVQLTVAPDLDREPPEDTCPKPW